MDHQLGHGAGNDPRSSNPVTIPVPRVGVVGVVGVVVILALIAVVLPLAIAARSGAFGIPRSDDWSYLLTLFRFTDTGRISFNNWVSMTLVGQVALTSPVTALLGRNIRAVQVFTALVGLAGLLTVVALGRLLVGRVAWALFVAVMVAVSPLWAPLAVSYMTDVPAFTAGMVTLVCGVIGLSRRPFAIGWIAASLVAGFVAFSIRQYAIVPALAVAIVAVWSLAMSGDRRRMRQVLVAVGVLVVAAAIVFLWWRGYSNAKSLSPALPTPHSIWDGILKATEFVRLLALLITPAVLLARPMRLLRNAWVSSRTVTLVFGGAMLVLQVGIYLHVRATPFVGNYLSRDGVLSRAVLEGNRPDVIPSALFDLLVFVGSTAAVVLAVAMVPFVLSLLDRLRTRRFTINDPAGTTIALTVVGYSAAYLLAVVTKLPLYDRYALPFVPLVAFQLLRVSLAVPDTTPSPDTTPRPLAAVGAAVALVVLATVGIAFAADSAEFDGTRWHVAQLAVDAGYPARKINGGFEWVNYHRGAWKQRSTSGELVAARRQGQAQYCVVVVVNPPSVPPGREIAREVSELPSRKRAEFVAIRTKRSCPAADRRAGRRP